MGWALRFLGVGNAAAVELGSASATIERDGLPWLTIDCGGEGLSAYRAHYGAMPQALFVTHTHMDHVGGFERLFVATWFDPARRGKVKLYVPATIVPLLHQRVGSYPNALAEGGVNFWDAFQVIPVGASFWHDGVQLEVFPARHRVDGRHQADSGSTGEIRRCRRTRRA
jgi:ribonuclease BN (tRNA processing enzyme)